MVVYVLKYFFQSHQSVLDFVGVLSLLLSTVKKKKKRRQVEFVITILILRMYECVHECVRALARVCVFARKCAHFLVFRFLNSTFSENESTIILL